jgi:hypothetical protein
MMSLIRRIELPEEDRRLMRELIKQTLKDRTEHGYLRCGDGTTIRRDGIRYQIDLSEWYEVHGSTPLTFHTHPSERNTIRDMMSASDLVHIRDENREVGCIGYSVRGRPFARCVRSEDIDTDMVRAISREIALVRLDWKGAEERGGRSPLSWTT